MCCNKENAFPQFPRPHQSRCPAGQQESPAFALIELLIVIAIIAILGVVVILVLNPAEMMCRARDANRVSDMTNNAISLYRTDISTER
jgi:prepilin-type N-terminal cleavage/methylation domain-containing protein